MKRENIKLLIISLLKFFVCTWIIIVILNLTFNEYQKENLSVYITSITGVLMGGVITIKTFRKKWTNWIVYIGIPVFVFIFLMLIGDYKGVKMSRDTKLKSVENIKTENP